MFGNFYVHKILGNKKGRTITATILILLVWYFGFVYGSAGSGLTKSHFENQLKTMSDGKIDIGDSKIDKLKSTGLYTAHWNGFTINAKVDSHNHLVIPYMVLTPPAGEMDEISLGQYQELIEDLSSIVDPKLSVDDRQHLIENDLNFNNQIMSGDEHSTSKDGIKFELNGGGAKDPNAWYSFMAYTENK